MPYKTKGKCVYKKDTGKKVGCTDGSVKKYLAALHANANESLDYELTKEELGAIIDEATEPIYKLPPTTRPSYPAGPFARKSVSGPGGHKTLDRLEKASDVEKMLRKKSRLKIKLRARRKEEQEEQDANWTPPIITLEEIVAEEYEKLLNEGPPVPRGPNFPTIIRRLTAPRMPFVRRPSMPALPGVPSASEVRAGTNLSAADEADLDKLARDMSEKQPWLAADDVDLVPSSRKTKKIKDLSHFESELDQMTLPAPTQTPVEDPTLKAYKQKYFGPDPDVMYRRIPERLPRGRTSLRDTDDNMGFVPDPAVYGWQPIGGGTFRRAYNIPGVEDKVLKVAIPGEKTGFAEDAGHAELQNKMEALTAYQTHPSGLAARVYDMHPDGHWIVQEKITPFRDWSEMFKHFPNFKEGSLSYSQGDPERAWNWRFKTIDVFSKIMEFNEPLSKSNISKKIAKMNEIEDLSRNIYLSAHQQRVYSNLEMSPEIKTYLKIAELYHPNIRSGRRLVYDERVVDHINSLISDPVVSNLRDFARGTSQFKPVYEVWDYRPGNLGVNARGELKILDSGFGI